MLFFIRIPEKQGAKKERYEKRQSKKENCCKVVN